MYQFDQPQVLAITVTAVEQIQAVYAVLADPKFAPKVEASPYYPPVQVGSTASKIEEPATEEDWDEPVRNMVEPITEDVEVDSAGVPFDPELHTGTKLKDGRWRAKKGMAEAAAAAAQAVPEPSPSADNAGTDNASDAEASSDEPGESDEFAAFYQAAAQTEQPAEPVVVERTWTEADLSALCNQAVQKLGGPSGVAPVKEMIAKFMPEGSDQVPHSRHIPADKREEFAQAIEALAGIEFAG